MKRMFVVALTVLAVAAPPLIYAQARPNFSGKWTYDQAKSGRGTAGNNPTVPFPTDLLIKHTPMEFDLETSTTRQDVIKVVYKLDGSEVTHAGPSGVTVKGKAKMDGEKLVIEEKRSFNSPAGEITNEIKEMYSLTGETLTVEKTMKTGGIENKGTAVYNKVTS